MALQVWLRVGDTSASDISLTTNGIAITDYPMATPEVDQGVIENLGDGDSLSVPSWRSVTESIQLHFSGASAAIVAAKFTDIERVLDVARQGSNGNFENKVYLRVQFDQDAAPWRSQILAAMLVPNDATDRVWRKYATPTLIITRRYYWEYETMQDLAVSSGVSAATTGYATVYNAHDSHATNQNWFQIDSALIGGSVPTPAYIRIKNTSGATRAVGAIYLGNYVNIPTSIDPIYLGSGASSSDTTPGTTEQNIYSWALPSSSLLDGFKGKFGRFVVAWSDRPAITTLVRAALQYQFPSPQVDLAVAEPILATENEFVTDIGAIALPPSGFIAGMGSGVHLVVKAKAFGVTDTLGINWLQIFPSGAGRYRVIRGIVNFSVAPNDEIVDDGPEGAVYGVEAGGTPVPLFRPLFSPLYLWPKKTQRFRLLISGGGSLETGVTWGVQVKYKPRRLTFT